ncbi:mannonate dehydratase [Petrocella sp. FN5]|uniref:mannonate dehydratase n=1 Tax=Petrocella sp. FN5 TaxID=3032002 RepID=UPI0023DBE9F1|nr:mannonate dehydratase [Petrocella sp. FN5]MDF1616854.1 mannonate dehydratase [Petrocella sp. FN5]
MKLGMGLYKHMLTDENFQFAKQTGCTHLIVHLAEYYSKDIVTATDAVNNYGNSKAFDEIWELDSMLELKARAAEYDLEIFGIENFSPADWYDVLLDGPKKYEQIEYLKKLIRNAGKAGIKSFGYNFSLAGVWGHQKKNIARGGAISACFNADELDIEAPIPNGEVWNMTYNSNGEGKSTEDIGYDELWKRLEWFLNEILPVAEEAGVDMALHPDDPPMPFLRKTPRLVYQPELYEKLIKLVPSDSNKIEFCMGSIQEMTEGNLYDAIEKYASMNKISYVHFRNVIGKVPDYKEVFLDEGDIDMLKALRLFKKHHFEGVLIPDHTPLMTCDAPWHAGMAYALGYMKAAMRIVQEE